ncbi:hypothetical protein FRB90_009151, partial [Tulasnella sp. 427]
AVQRKEISNRTEDAGDKRTTLQLPKPPPNTPLTPLQEHPLWHVWVGLFELDMSPNDNDAIVRQISNSIFDRLLDDVLMDIGEKAHKEAARARAVCNICHTKCRSIHVPGASNAARPSSNNGNLTVPGSDQSGEPSRPGTPLATVVNGKSSASGTSTPNSKDKSSNVYFDCLKCGQAVASNRYAPHLERCMGLNGNTSRRAAVSRTSTKTKLDNTLSRSNTPQLLVNGDDPPPPPAPAPARKGRPPKNAGATPAKPKKGKANAHSATPEGHGPGKRPASPTPTPPKPGKKLKSEVPSPSLSSKTLPNGTIPIPSPAHKKTNPKVPSRLRGSPTSAPSASRAGASSTSPSTMDMDLDLEADASPQSPTPSGTSESFKFGSGSYGDRGGSTGLKTVPGFDLDADDQADTDSGDDDDDDD